ncbi:MAG TPA: polyphenol oxidase family protein [Candidatus Cloacimonadota bacterium]|nr:polyphenol oxidase family protein [Candidatus Cloacimonadota bacterium]
MKAFSFLGDGSLDYRTLMREQCDLRIQRVHIPIYRLVIAEQTHSCIVHECTEADCGAGLGSHPQILEADGLITSVPNQFVLIRTADCTPVILIDQDLRAVAAIHSGRESTRKNICGKAVRQMIENYGCSPERITALIGAGICAEHYEVSEAIWDEFIHSLEEQGITTDGMLFRHPDVRLTIYRQLIHAGLAAENIQQNTDCTFESDNYFSFRKDGSHNRQINLAGLVI